MAYNNKNNFRKQEKKQNKTFVLDLVKFGLTGNKIQYNYSTLTDILAKLNNNGVFNCISIPVYMYRNDCTYEKGSDKKGTMQVGFIKKYEDDSLEVSVFGNFVDYVSRLKRPVVFARVYVTDEVVTNIIGLDICEEDRYGYLFNDDDSE